MKKKKITKSNAATKIIAGLHEALKHSQGQETGAKEWKVLNKNVHHPSHYGGADNPYETIKVLEARLTREEFIGAMKFNVYKYNDRAKHKGEEVENYEKALFYQTRLVQRSRND